MALRAVYEDVDDGWVQARLVELPGVITAAPTRAAAREALADALREYLLAISDGTAAELDHASEPFELTIEDDA